MIILRKYPEEQKEFSILSEISRLGLKKGTKNYIRKRKRDIVNKLIQNKREFLAKTKKTERKLTNLRKETKENELIADNLKKENIAKPVHSSTTDEITAIFTIVRSFMAFVVYRLTAKIINSPNKTKYT